MIDSPPSKARPLHPASDRPSRAPLRWLRQLRAVSLVALACSAVSSVLAYALWSTEVALVGPTFTVVIPGQ